MDDGTLLYQYVQDRSQPAFAELVRRNLPLVYSTAYREVRDTHLAQDVSQAVFLVLSQRASHLGRPKTLAAWLFTVTRHAAATARAKELRRQHHEHQAAQQRPEMQPEQIDQAWQDIEPKLNAALAKLGPKDREALLLRFFEDQSMKEIAEAMGTTEAATKMRIGRALAKLRKMLGGGEGMPSVPALTTVLQSKAILPVPSGLAGSITSAVLSGVTGATNQAALIAKGAMNMMMWAKIKIVAAIAAVVLLGSGLGVIGLTRTGAADTAPPPQADAQRPTTQAVPPPTTQRALRPTTVTVAEVRQGAAKYLEQFKFLDMDYRLWSHDNDTAGKTVLVFADNLKLVTADGRYRLDETDYRQPDNATLYNRYAFDGKHIWRLERPTNPQALCWGYVWDPAMKQGDRLSPPTLRDRQQPWSYLTVYGNEEWTVINGDDCRVLGEEDGPEGRRIVVQANDIRVTYSLAWGFLPARAETIRVQGRWSQEVEQVRQVPGGAYFPIQMWWRSTLGDELVEVQRLAANVPIKDEEFQIDFPDLTQVTEYPSEKRFVARAIPGKASELLPDEEQCLNEAQRAIREGNAADALSWLTSALTTLKFYLDHARTEEGRDRIQQYMDGLHQVESILKKGDLEQAAQSLRAARAR